MQVDRIYFQIRQFYMKGGKTDIDTLIVSLCYYSGERREEHAENRKKNTHVQTFELIEESSDSSSWLVHIVSSNVRELEPQTFASRFTRLREAISW